MSGNRKRKSAKTCARRTNPVAFSQIPIRKMTAWSAYSEKRCNPPLPCLQVSAPQEYTQRCPHAMHAYTSLRLLAQKLSDFSNI